MIGIFDSGAGGLTVYKELLKALPKESYVYVADTAHCPYGPKSKEYITRRAKKISEYLISKGAQIIVVACNTATAAAIHTLRQSFDIPFIGMEPAVKPATLLTKSGVIGVLATKGTLKGELYLNTSEKFARSKEIKIIEIIGTGLVEAVEAGNLNTPETKGLLKKYITPMAEQNADCIVLGCTHYPFLEDTIKEVVNEVTGKENSMQIINPAPAVAKRAKEVLDSLNNNNCNCDKSSSKNCSNNCDNSSSYNNCDNSSSNNNCDKSSSNNCDNNCNNNCSNNCSNNNAETDTPAATHTIISTASDTTALKRLTQIVCPKTFRKNQKYLSLQL